MNLDQVLHDQDGVVSRRHVLSAGETDSDIERRLRRREWARVHPGVYVDHTGAPSWRQRAWAAVLLHWPAALADSSALRVLGLTRHDRESDPVRLVVAAPRRVDDPPGVVTRRDARFEDVVRMNRSPPRVSVEHAALGCAAAAVRQDDAVAVLADVCQTRHSTPERLSSHLHSLPRLRRRRLLMTVLEDVADGAHSALEHRYLVQVERPHGLPTGARQRRVRQGRTAAYRDVEYVGLGTVVELDGRLHHGAVENRWRDLDRDIESVVAGDVTLRAGWGQVLQPCRLASAVARLLRARGWTGSPRPCGPGCPLTTTEDPRHQVPGILR